MSSLTAARARELLSYDLATGIVTWRVSPAPTAWVKPGDRAGSSAAKGYRAIRIDGRAYQEHRVIWLIVFGRWPAGQIDHRNRVRNDNRFLNLRDVTGLVNSQNRAGWQVSKSGLAGAYPRRHTFYSKIDAGGQTIFLGNFATAEAAHEAWVTAKCVYHPEASRV